MKRSALSVCVCAELDGVRVPRPMDSTHYGALRLYSGMPAKVVYVKSVSRSAYAYPCAYRRVCANISKTCFGGGSENRRERPRPYRRQTYGPMRIIPDGASMFN